MFKKLDKVTLIAIINIAYIVVINSLNILSRINLFYVNMICFITLTLLLSVIIKKYLLLINEDNLENLLIDYENSSIVGENKKDRYLMFIGVLEKEKLKYLQNKFIKRLKMIKGRFDFMTSIDDNYVIISEKNNASEISYFDEISNIMSKPYRYDDVWLSLDIELKLLKEVVKNDSCDYEIIESRQISNL